MTRWRDMSRGQAGPARGVAACGAILLCAGEIGLAATVAEDLARDGADLLLFHLPADEAAAIAIALRVEAEGRRCELVCGEADDEEACQEAVLHAAFLGRGRIGALVSLEGPSRAADAAAGMGLILRLALPLLAPDAQILHLESEPVGDASPRPARRAGARDARGMLARLRRDHGVRGRCVTAAAAGLAWAAEEARAQLEAVPWSPAPG